MSTKLEIFSRIKKKWIWRQNMAEANCNKLVILTCPNSHIKCSFEFIGLNSPTVPGPNHRDHFTCNKLWLKHILYVNTVWTLWMCVPEGVHSSVARTNTETSSNCGTLFLLQIPAAAAPQPKTQTYSGTQFNQIYMHMWKKNVAAANANVSE